VREGERASECARACMCRIPQWSAGCRKELLVINLFYYTCFPELFLKLLESINTAIDFCTVML
jgi:hypothetical protein